MQSSCLIDCFAVIPCDETVRFVYGELDSCSMILFEHYFIEVNRDSTILLLVAIVDGLLDSGNTLVFHDAPLYENVYG